MSRWYQQLKVITQSSGMTNPCHGARVSELCDPGKISWVAIVRGGFPPRPRNKIISGGLCRMKNKNVRFIVTCDIGLPIESRVTTAALNSMFIDLDANLL